MGTQIEVIKEQQEVISQMKQELERLAEAGLEYGTVVGTDGKLAILARGGGYVYVLNNAYKAGDQVLVHPQTGQIVQKCHAPRLGEICTIERVKDGLAELAVRGEPKVVSAADFKDLKRGDLIILDPMQRVIIHVVERAKDVKPVISKITWDDVGGHHDAKMVLREAIELPYKFPHIYKGYGKRQPKGIMMYGPPGCGKTLLGKATATAIGAEGAFLSVKGPEILDPYVGVAESRVRALFAKARDYKAESGKPALIFIDEADAILAARGGRHSYMEKTIVPAFLTEMDGLEDSAAIIILSTNRADMLDPAIVREGRIDYKVEIKRPNMDEAKDILDIHVGKTPVAKGVKREVMIEYAATRLYDVPPGKVPHSGALLAGTVDKAVAHAIRRDIATGRISGLSEQDFTWATDQVIKQEAFA